MKKLKILCIHGVGQHEADIAWVQAWADHAIQGTKPWNPTLQTEADLLYFEKFFADAPINAATYAKAISAMTFSGLTHGIGDLFRRNRGVTEVSNKVRWLAGMVVQWADNPQLRDKVRKAIRQKITNYQPDVILAHSLGSLVTYDTFVHGGDDLVRDRYYVTFGSQIGNPFVRNIFGGRIVPLPAKRWFHLFNPQDDVLTARLNLSDTNFLQVITDFELEGVGDHDADGYLSHASAVQVVWSEISGAEKSQLARNLKGKFTASVRGAGKPLNRALIIGINDYPDPKMRLEGCVNDAFRMSETLQECGFPAEGIRLLLNERATTDAIRERLAWLLDRPQPGDQRFLAFSGHGAQIESYGLGESVDRQDECLVPYDFDWSLDRAILDDFIHDLYVDLPEGLDFYAFFDCCHSGGLAREGGPRVRGLQPPDDVRHRSLEWDGKLQLWKARNLPPVNPDLAASTKSTSAISGDGSALSNGQSYLGRSGNLHRLLRSSSLRTLPNAKYDSVRKDLHHHGPYLPVIFQACQESELACEYHHGAVPYGAFTFVTTNILRQHAAQKKTITFASLIKRTNSALKALGYTQTPVLVGPSVKMRKPMPWKK